MITFPQGLIPGTESVQTVSSTAVGITAATIKPSTGLFKGQQAKAVFITIETDAIRIILDGVTTVTNAIGHLMAVTTDDPIIIYGKQAIKNLKMIRVTNDAAVRVTPFF